MKDEFDADWNSPGWMVIGLIVLALCLHGCQLSCHIESKPTEVTNAK